MFSLPIMEMQIFRADILFYMRWNLLARNIAHWIIIFAESKLQKVSYKY